MKPQVLILMTALLPTTGHADLVRFAMQIPARIHPDGGAQVHVLLSHRTFEPVPRDVRVASIQEISPQVNVVGDTDDAAPQNPPDHPDFWGWWAWAVQRAFPNVPTWEYVVASETYGAQVAKTLGAQFLPFDIPRELNPAKSTDIRSDMAHNWHQILPATRRWLTTTVTFFGQESVGKTTVSQLVAQQTGATWIPEYARGYLDVVGTELTSQKNG